MKLIGITQRVVMDSHHKERRDALDQRWSSWLLHLGYTPYPIPNKMEFLTHILKLPLYGVILSNGNTPNTDAPERDAVEAAILNYAVVNQLPIFGVCRGMQVILKYFGAKLKKVEGHVNQSHIIELYGKKIKVNSYHEYGVFDVPKPLEVLSRAEDGVIEAIRHPSLPIEAVMWHPEREI